MDLVLVLLASAFVIAIPLTLHSIIVNPFHYPYKTIYINITGKRNINIMDEVDAYLSKGNYQKLLEHQNVINSWKQKCSERVNRSLLKKHRLRQFQKSIDDAYCYEFILYREHTRYKQMNYQRHSYTECDTDKVFKCDLDFLKHRDSQLAEIGYECTLRQYAMKDQRKLMTKKLRQKILRKYNYTCCKCGLYSPAGDYLHIDHIIPISKGGKTVESNLQVLCSVCNLHKSDKED